mmetsp:Transcript_23017/g.71688  ORF Transcript_23017/g.71688 Transcript_23017/m.71688 type:complete len:339 (+) Transcript_23017:2-1018(+)
MNLPPRHGPHVMLSGGRSSPGALLLLLLLLECLLPGHSAAQGSGGIVSEAAPLGLGDALCAVQHREATVLHRGPAAGDVELATGPRIPRVLMQTDGTSAQEASLRRQWLAANKGWEYVFLNDTGAMAFLSDLGEDYRDAFHKLTPGAMKADFLRLAWLYKRGGAYVDVDNKPGDLAAVADLADVVVPKSFGQPDDCVGHLYNAVMLATPGSKFIKRVLDIALDRIASSWKDTCGNCQLTCYGIAGPTLLGKEVCKALSRHTQGSCTFQGGGVSGRGCSLPLNTTMVMKNGESVHILEERAHAFADRREGTPFAAYEAQCWQGRIYRGEGPEALERLAD